nr:MAG TPA: hypothetical protein [Caudoviricetes sp.]
MALFLCSWFAFLWASDFTNPIVFSPFLRMAAITYSTLGFTRFHITLLILNFLVIPLFCFAQDYHVHI